MLLTHARLPLPLAASRLGIAAVSVIALLALPARAQQQVNQATGLDANLQVGSGGVNPYGVAPDFRARNLLITGNVTNGREFRGDVGYGAVGSFGGTLGSDDLFRFRADAFSSSPTNVNIPPADRTGDYGLGGGNVIYNSYFNVTPDPAPAGTTRTVVNAAGTRAAFVSPSQRFNPELAGIKDLTATHVGNGRLDNRIGSNAAGVGVVIDEQGRALQVDASPVFGLRRTEIPNAAPDTTDAITDPAAINTFRAAEPIRTSLGVDGNPADPTGASAGADRFDPNAPRGAAANTLRSGNASDRPTLASVNAVDPTAQRDPSTGLPLSLQLGARLTPGQITTRTTGEAAAADSVEKTRLEQINKAIFRPLDTTAAKEGEDAYLDLLRKIRGEGDAENPGDAQDAGPRRPAWMDQLDAPEDDAVRNAEDRRLNAIARILRAAQEDEDLAPGQTPDPNAARDKQITTAAMKSLLNQLSYDLPRVETLKGERQDRINAAFGLGEQALAQEHYFNAEAIYRQLVLDAPGNPLARVGLVHAQMAAGMIRSAAFNLRALFEDHPELIATRYAEQLLPPQKRVQWLRDELQKMIDDEKQPNRDAGLMLAYLGYQVESRQLVRYGLAVAQEAAPLDPLMPLLRGIWLGTDNIQK